MGYGEDGWPIMKIFDGASSAYTYDDLVFMPGHVAFDANTVDLGSHLTKTLALNSPIIAGASDSLTESDMAIAVGLAGGLGVVHRQQPTEAQAAMVQRVKGYMSGFILEPVTLDPSSTLLDLEKLRRNRGVSSVAITVNGKLGGKLVGIITARDIEGIDDVKMPLSQIMVRDVKSATEPISLHDAQERLRLEKVGKLPIVDAENRLISMVARCDMKKLRDFPKASKDKHGRLLCAAAVTAGDTARARTLIQAGADVLFVDICDGNLDQQAEFIRQLKGDFPQTSLVVGPVASCREAKRLAESGADALRAGCAPQLRAGGEVAAVGRAEASVVYQITKYARLHFEIPVFAEGGVHNSGQALKALCLGAAGVVLSEALLGTDEALGGEKKGFFQASLPTYTGRAGVTLPSTGAAGQVVRYLEEGLRRGLWSLGAASLPALHEAMLKGELRAECRCPFASQVCEARRLASLASPYPEVMPTLPDLSTGPNLY